MKKHVLVKMCLLTAIVIGCMSVPAGASTVAYWRFEAGPVGTNVIHTGPAGTYFPDIMDISGNGNDLSVWATGGGSGYVYRANVGVPFIQQTGMTNTLSVKNTGGGPAMWCATPAMQNMQPAAFTVEVTFKTERGGWKTFVGRDSFQSRTDGGDANVSALYLQTTDNPTMGLAIKFCDVQGFWHEASVANAYTGFVFGTDPDGNTAPWYSVVGVSDGNWLRLYRKDLTAGTPYALIAETNMTTNPNNTDRRLTKGTKGTSTATDWTPGNWSVGRGLYNAGHGDRAYGYIDEVRISDSALRVEQFLYSQGPIEPVFPKQDTFLSSTNAITYQWNQHVVTDGVFGNYAFYLGANLADMQAAVPATPLFTKVIADLNTTAVSDYAESYKFSAEYFWRVDVTTYEPNYADPNTTPMNLKKVIQGSPIRFFGPKACPTLTISGNVSNLPDPITHNYVPKNATFTVTIDKGPINNTAIAWYKVVGEQDNLVAPNPADPADTKVVTGSGGYEILPLPANLASATQTSLTILAAGPAQNGSYYARVKLADPLGGTTGCEDNSPVADLFVRDNANAGTNYLVHRYGFDGDAKDSIGTAHGTVVDLNTSNHAFENGQLVLNNAGLSSRPVQTDPNGTRILEVEGAYVDLPNGIISPLGKSATFMAWFTYTPVGGDNWPRVFDFGTSSGGAGYSTGAESVVMIEGKPYVGPVTDQQEYIMLSPQQGGGPAWRFESIIRPPSNSVFADPADNTALKNVEVCVTCVFDSASGVSTVYLNGIQVAQSANNTQNLANLSDVNNWLGRSQWPDAMFSGKLNEFRIYDIPLSKYWVKAYYEQGPDNYTAVPNPCVQEGPNSMDFNKDCVVNISDFAAFAAEWLKCDRLYGCL